mgnify:CR=1 FL=1
MDDLHNVFLPNEQNLHYICREPGQSSVLGRDATSVEDELTQYTLTPTEVGNSPAVRDKV